MTLSVGLDVSLKMTSICFVEANGSPVWEGNAESEIGDGLVELTIPKP